MMAHNYPPEDGYTWACDRGEVPPDAKTAYNRDCEGCYVVWRVQANNPRNTFRFGSTGEKLYSLPPNKYTESQLREWYFSRGKVSL